MHIAQVGAHIRSQYPKKRGNIAFVTLRVVGGLGRPKDRMRKVSAEQRGAKRKKQRGGSVQKEKKMGRGRCKGRLVSRQVATIKPSD